MTTRHKIGMKQDDAVDEYAVPGKPGAYCCGHHAIPCHLKKKKRYFTDLLRHLCVYLGHCSKVIKIAQSDTFKKMMMFVGFVLSLKWH